MRRNDDAHCSDDGSTSSSTTTSSLWLETYAWMKWRASSEDPESIDISMSWKGFRWQWITRRHGMKPIA